MSENPLENKPYIVISVEKKEYTVSPGGSIGINLSLHNLGTEEDSFVLSVQGVPASWISSSLPVVELSPGERKETDLLIQVPSSIDSGTGSVQLSIIATSQHHPEQIAQVDVVLSVTAGNVPSRVVIEMESLQFAVAAGSSITIGVTLKNNGLITDTLRLYVDGIPANWVSTPSPLTQLEPGEERKIPVTIAPPLSAESRAGRYPIKIRVVSQEVPDQGGEKECILTVGAFTQFSSALEPYEVKAGKDAQVVITNEGNIRDSFKITWASDEDILAFELSQEENGEEVFKEVKEHVLNVESGDSVPTVFRAGLRKRPFLGGAKEYPYLVQVKSASDEEENTNQGVVKERAIIPFWAIPVALVLCLLFVAGGIWFYNNQQTPPVAGDGSWERVQQAGVLRVATSADYPPFSYYNQDFVIDGFDAALIREIGQKLGVQVEITDYAFEGLGATLQVGQADAIIAALSVTPGRQNLVDFSNIYYVGEDGILAKVGSGIPAITDPTQLANLRIGVQKSSVYEAWADQVLVGSGLVTPEMIFSYAKPEQAIRDLKQGLLEVVILDLQPALFVEQSDPEVELVGRGLNPQQFAIALPKGASSLKAQIDQALAALQSEGRVSQLAQAYLGLQPGDILPPPTPAPTQIPTAVPSPIPSQVPTQGPTPIPTPAPCIDAMEFVGDLNYDDEDLTNFPKVNPGEHFRKGWRIKNTGTCAWDSSFYISYVRGSEPAAQMGGQPTAILGLVQPGQTYDMYVDLIAPQTAGKYVGYWQMHNSAMTPFGQTIWVAVKVRKTEPTQPPPTATVPPLPTSPEATATPVPPTPTEEPGSDLLDTTWILDGYLVNIDDGNLTQPIPGTTVNLVFDKQGMINGNAGCNPYNGRFVTDGMHIAFKDLSISRGICDQPPGIMEQEAQFINWLQRTEEYRIDQNGQLEFIFYVMENNQRVEKILMVLYDQRIGPP
jgi:polar amino acid transport system substrate-binding protein